MNLSQRGITATSDTDEGLALTSETRHYDITASTYSSGFFIAPKGISINNILSHIKTNALPSTTRPNFKKHSRYWLYIPINNFTKENDWVLHSSYFLIDKFKILLSSQKGSTTQTHKVNLAETTTKSKINVLGKAIKLKLEANTKYILAVELSADNDVRAPYLGLMSSPIYDHWSLKMDYAYKIAIGVILGLILVSMICSVAIKDITFIWFSIASIALLSLNVTRSHVPAEWFLMVNEQPYWIWFVVSITGLSIFLFFRSFLFGTNNQKKNYDYRLITSFNYAIAISCGVVVLTQFLPGNICILIFSVQGIIMVMLCSYAGIQKVIKEGNYYLIFMLGWAPVFLTFLTDIYLLFHVPEVGESTLLYKNFLEPYFQVLHMILHLLALLLRVVDLKKQRIAAEAKNRAKSDFLAAASHDLRQPLHSMKLFLSHLSPHIKSTEGLEIISKIKNIHANMSDSFTSLMDLSQLEAASADVNQKSFELPLLFERLRMEYQEQASCRGIRLHVRQTKLCITSDPILLERILRNLLSNATKFTKQGGILLSVRRRKQHALIQVWDTGIGIAEQDQKRIFDIYQQGSTETSEIGSGLGLATVKHLCTLLDHPLCLKSKLGQGSVFELTVPISPKHKNIPNYKKNDFAKENHADPQKQEQDYAPSTSDLNIYMNIHEKKLAQEITNYLHYWGYSSLNDRSKLRSDQKKITIIGDFSESTVSILNEVKQLTDESRYAVIFFTKDIDGQVNRILESDSTNKKNVYKLSPSFKPAQLRSLLRHLSQKLG